MGWKLSDLVDLFPIRTTKVEDKTPSMEDESCRPPVLSDQPLESEKIDIAIPSFQVVPKKNIDHSSSGPLPCDSDPLHQTLENLLKKGAYRLKIKQGIKKKDLFRFLLAKVLYEREEGLHLDEYLVVWELYLQLLEVNSKDPTFREKYNVFFENTVEFFREFGNQREFPVRIEDDENSAYLERLYPCLEPMLPSRSAYFGLKGQRDLKSGFSLVFETELVQRRIPEARRIGVGYRDKGSRRDRAFDGSPDWREVAASLSESRIRWVESHTRVPRESPEFDWDLDYKHFDHPREDDLEDEGVPFPSD